MRIRNVTTYALEHQLKEEQQFAFSQAWSRKRTCLICRIDTDEGITGWGEAFGPARIHKTIIDEYYTPWLIDKCPADIEVIWEELYNMMRDSGQKGVTVQALSAIDIALWDIKGKLSNQPVYQAMGGSFRDRIAAYATGMYRRYTDDEIRLTTQEAVSHVENGFQAIKIKIGFGFDYDLEIVRRVREAVGSDIKIMVDANHAYNAMTAVQIGRVLEPFNITWFEEPVPPEDLAGYQEVRSKLSIPISGGEAEFTRYGMFPLIQKRCVDIVQPDCTICGGLSEFRKITTLCTIANLQSIPHVWGSGIALMAGIHAAFNTPHFPPSLEPSKGYIEYDRTPNILREHLAHGIPEVKEGWIDKPLQPGLGIEIDEDFLKKYSD